MALPNSINLSGADAAKPASGFVAGRIYVATDTHKLYVDSGTAWVDSGLGAGGGGSGAVTAIADSLLTAAAASFDFASIPGTYRHLRVLLSGRLDTSGGFGSVGLTLNGDTGAHYDYAVSGNTTDAQSGQASMLVAIMPDAGAGAGRSGGAAIDLPNYAGTALHKQVLSLAGLHNVTYNQARQYSGLWLSTAAIARVTIAPASGNFATGSRCTLYGYS